MRTTNDLLNVLNSEIKNESDLDSYIERIDEYQGLDYMSYFESIRTRHGTKKNTIAKSSGISRTYCYQMMNGSRRPGRDNAISLAIAAGFTLEETLRYLELLEEGILYAKNKRDALIIYSISHKSSVSETNELLYSKGEKTLGE